MPKAVFAGCARNCSAFLPAVLANIEALAATYDDHAVVIVENDSTDDTRAQLRGWAAERPRVRLIELDGLADRHPLRTDRIAQARNAYLAAAREPAFADFDDLVMLDFDNVNSNPLDVAAFARARAWLWAAPERQAVFANSWPFYYDVWALRHPAWSPDDCWAAARAAYATLPVPEANRRHVFSRQMPVSAGADPIFVDSAFGGLGIYRREAAAACSYAGLDAHGNQICEHVAFNKSVAGADGVMAIFPPLLNKAPPRHILAAIGGAKRIELEQDGETCVLLGPREHPIETFRAEHPLYDRRLPRLTEIVGRHAPDDVFIDIGANIGDSIALARLSGGRMRAIAIEASLTYCKYLWANMLRAPVLFENVQMIWGYAGAAGEEAEVSLGAGTGSAAAAASDAPTEKAPVIRLDRVAGHCGVSLVKIDTDGFDQNVISSELAFLGDKQPIVWAEAQTETQADEATWRAVFEAMRQRWPHMVLFDNFGFAVAGGETAVLADQALALMAYARRQRARHAAGGNEPTFHYLDVALFPERFEPVFHAFLDTLRELRD